MVFQCGDTALLNAVEYGLTKHVEKLLAHGADANALDTNGRSAMDIAGEHGFVDIINVLAKNCPGLDSKLTHVCCLLIWMLTLVMAVRHEYAEKLETLYDRVHDKMSNVDGAERGTPMDWTNAKGENAIQVACARGRPEILEMLVLLTLTAVLNHPSMKMDVLQNCENSFSFLRDDNFFPFFVAAKMPAHLEVMEVLIRHSAKLHFPTRQSRDTVRTISYCDIGKKSSFIVGWSVPLLASWLMRVAAGKVSNLLLDLASSKAIRHMQLRRVIQSLTVRRHTYDALLFTLTILFTPQAVDVGQCSNGGCCEVKSTLVTQKLVTDARSL
ncbi:hypothetical protein GN244_ATG16688 [Phytophthora infestans]|uniref:Ankyrin repeat protein n=1 Tax=Phytophthora infestans TaxID=4787 RepID=A0A833W666_PHYIN|nr:hypothetical protein GN244_ATG16688 [Phytophthora infestans]